MTDRESLSIQKIERLIHVIRGQKVMLDTDLAEMYGVETRVLKQAVRRNQKRFPNDFQTIFEAIRQLMTPPEKPRKPIGFEIKEPKRRYGKK